MNEPDLAPDAVRRRRLLYRATHRGTHEADLLVGGFVGPRIGAMGVEELGALEVLLELPDTDLADWITGRRALPDASATVPPPRSPFPQREGGLLVLAMLRQMKAAAGA